MKLPVPSDHATLTAVAMFVMGTLGMATIFHPVAAGDHDLVLVIVSALGGALGGNGAAKIADKFTQSTGANPTIQADAPSLPQSQSETSQ